MGDEPVSAFVLARLGVALGGLLVVVGVAVVAGVGAALILAGAALIAYCLLLVDTGERKAS